MCVPHFYLLFGLLCVRPLIDTMSCNGTGLSSVLNLSGSWKIIEIRSISNKGGTENDPWFNLGHAGELVVRTPVGNCLLLSPRNEMDTKEQNCWCWCSWGVTHLGGINIQYIKLMLKMTHSVGAVWFGALKEKTYRYCSKEKKIMRGQLPSSIGSSHLRFDHCSSDQFFQLTSSHLHFDHYFLFPIRRLPETGRIALWPDFQRVGSS